jgi:hypothetical protein
MALEIREETFRREPVLPDAPTFLLESEESVWRERAVKVRHDIADVFDVFRLDPNAEFFPIDLEVVGQNAVGVDKDGDPAA